MSSRSETGNKKIIFIETIIQKHVITNPSRFKDVYLQPLSRSLRSLEEEEEWVKVGSLDSLFLIKRFLYLSRTDIEGNGRTNQ